MSLDGASATKLQETSVGSPLSLSVGNTSTLPDSV